MAELSMQDAMKLFLKKSKIKSEIRSMQIQDVWEEVMGKTIARYTDKVQIINSTLFVTTSVAQLKNELHFQKTKIIERINEAMGEKLVHEIVIR